LVVVNTRSRRGGEDFTAFVDELRGAGLEVVALRLTNPAEVDAAIREHADAVDLIAVGGGDGTMNAAAEALLAAHLPFGVLPLGTANDLARVLGIPRDPKAAARVILEDRRRWIDLGRANDKLFFNIATVGLSARLAKAMDRATKRRYGPLAYAVTVARIGLGHPFAATIRTADGERRVRAIQIAVGNGRYHGGGVIVHEEAAIDDRLLHLYALEPHSPWELLRKLPWLLRGKHADLEGVLSLAASSIEVITDRELPLNTDGELTTRTPARFTVLPEALEVFAPVAGG
jgi:YegS/Rv2252/BmrU family lipid kinase